MEDLREEVFWLTRNLPGMNYQALEVMTFQERLWYLQRLVRALEAEAEALKTKRR